MKRSKNEFGHFLVFLKNRKTCNDKNILKIKMLKNSRAPGKDCISNEIIKCSKETIIEYNSFSIKYLTPQGIIQKNNLRGRRRRPKRQPIDWLKIYPNLVVLFLPFFYYFPYILSGHWKTSNPVEQIIEIIIQCKYEIVQQYWLPLSFSLNDTKPISCLHVSSYWCVDFPFLKLLV